MSADPTSVMARIAVLQAEIINPVSGSACKSYANVPYAISAADMPLFVTFAGALTRNERTGEDNEGREFLETRSYNMVLYTAPYGSGIEGEQMGLLLPWFELTYAKFMAYPHLRALAGVVDSIIIGDTGSQLVSFANQSYYGIRFTLSVTGRVRRLIGTGD